MTSIHSTLVFVPDEEHVWLAAEIQSENTETGVTDVIIRDEALANSLQPGANHTRSISLRKYGLTTLPLQNPDMPAGGVDDMCALAYLHEPSILDNLRRFPSHFQLLFQISSIIPTDDSMRRLHTHTLEQFVSQ